MVEEIDSDFNETTPEKIMKKDKKFRPQRMAWFYKYRFY